MAEQLARDQRFEYVANSNLVLQTDRSTLRREEPTGEAESLAGRVQPKSFGDRAERVKPKSEEVTKAKKRHAEKQAKEAKSFRAMGPATILTATEDLEVGAYRPKTRETRATYELILAFVQQFLGDQPQDVLRGAADEVLATLKTDDMKDVDRKRQIESLLAPISSEQFAQVVNLGKKITDFAEEKDEAAEAEGIDNETGVALIFDEEEEEDAFEVKDAEDQDDEEEGGEEATTGVALASAGHDNEESAPAAAAKTGPAPLMPSEIDAYWLQRKLSLYFEDALTTQNLAKSVLEVLERAKDARDCENRLVMLLDYDKFDLVKLLTSNRDVILYCTKLGQAQSPAEREAIERSMQENPQLASLLRRQAGSAKTAAQKRAARGEDSAMEVDMSAPAAPVSSAPVPRANVNLEQRMFTAGSHFMSNAKVSLPDGSFRKQFKGYEEVHVPYPKTPPLAQDEKLVAISEMPEWAHPAFTTKSLNRIQSRVYPIAFQSDINMLVCAPTGAGKTNVAMLTILQTISKYRLADGSIDLDAFKIVYIAPMKALVQEMVGNFSERLKPFNINVAELTGDRQLTKMQIAEKQVIVTTPEKWDIITRKSNDRSYTNLVRLIIIDEVHLLHDDRGPVLESLIARQIRTIEKTRLPVRMVALSATLPNYDDVATFLRVPKEGVFFFNNTYRPCPLQQQYIGITEKKALKRFQISNEIVYNKVEAFAGKQQVIIFVHSRKETSKTARMLREMAIEKDKLGLFLHEDAASREILRSEAEKEDLKNVDLQELLPYGFGIHHAGMKPYERALVEALFAAGHIKVLVSTATLAWGVNLPAHAVIIKGTQIYNPEKGRWVELSPQDVMQMIGRAGRPQYDTFGEGILITTNSELQYYLSLLNQQLPIESQFISKLADNLNAEIVQGTVTTRDEAVDWLGYTYLFVRMLRAPSVYSVPVDELDSDPTLRQQRLDLIHAAAVQLDKTSLIKYDRKSGRFLSTELGRISSHYYISHTTMANFNTHLKPSMTEIELLRVFSVADEFKFIPVREEEKLELQKLLERVPIPVKESMEEPSAKINVLLQSYISQLKLEGFALAADMIYVTQSAGRLLRALFEIALKRGWASLAEKALDMCKMVDKRCWRSTSPLRQFRGAIPEDVLRKLERRDIAFERLYDLNPHELGELVRVPSMGKLLHRAIHQLPKLDLQAHVQPISRSTLRVQLTITPDFQYDEKVHGVAETFWVLVEDVDQESVLFHDMFMLKSRFSEDAHTMDFMVPLFDPLPPNYYVKIISDRWLHSAATLPVSFKHLILPERFPPHTELLDLQPQPVSSLGRTEFVSLFKERFQFFNPIQTQAFPILYNTDDNTLIGARSGSGKTVCAELAMLRLWNQKPTGRVVYVAAHLDTLKLVMAEWQARFSALNRTIVLLTGETSADLKLLERAHVVLSTPQHWDSLSRRWRQRKNVQNVDLFVVDGIHLLGGQNGPSLEVVCSRMRFIASQTQQRIRIVALAASLANARDLGEWLGCPPHAIFNFPTSVGPVLLETNVQSFTISHQASLMLAMVKPTYTAICAAAGKPAIVFVPSRKQTRLTATELMAYVLADIDGDAPSPLLHCDVSALEPYLEKLSDRTLHECLRVGIGYYHEAMTPAEKQVIEKLFNMGAIQVAVASRETAWGIPLTSQLVVLSGTQYFDGSEHRYVDYPIAEVLHMIGRATRPMIDDASRCLLLCSSAKKDLYKKFLFEGLPLESHLHLVLHDHFNAEIVTKTIENKQDAVDYLTWTFLYRRITQNPNYYGLQGVTNRHISDHLSELVETTLSDLEHSKCIAIENEMNVSPLNLGMIAAYYNVHYTTIELFAMSLTDKTKLKGLLEIVSSSSEYSDIPVRHHEDLLLERLMGRMPVKLAEPKYTDPHTKVNVLFQAHFSRTQLSADMEADVREIVARSVRLVQASVDVIASNGWLSPAIAAMELSQMIVQAVWDSDSPLRQIPHFGPDMIRKCKEAGVTSVFDLLDLEDDARTALLTFPKEQLRDVILFCNHYPNVEVSYDIENKEDVSTGASSSLHVKLERDGKPQAVVAPFFPQKKDESWWLVLGDPATNTLLANKRVTLQEAGQYRLDFVPPRAGDVTYKLYFMCDSYVGCDQEYEIELSVKQGEEEEEDEEDAMQD